MEEDYNTWMQESSADFTHFAGSSTVVDIRPKEKDGIFFMGSYTRFGKTQEARFIRYPSDHKELCRQIFTSSSQAGSLSVLSPVAISSSFDNQWIYMGYTFEKANVRDQVPVFALNNGIMGKNWRTQVLHLLITFQSMHNDGVFHGGLEKVDNYVYDGGKIRILGPTQVSENKTEAQIAALKEADIQGFRLFLDQVLIIASGRHSVDLDLFYDLIANPNVNNKIQCLINHPVLKDEDGRLIYFGHWYDCCLPIRSVPPMELSNFETNLFAELNHFINWDSLLDQFYVQRYTNPKKNVLPYDGNNVLDFLRFVRNEGKHLVLTNLKTAVEIERDLQRMFPGLISILHNCVSELNCSYYRVARVHGV